MTKYFIYQDNIVQGPFDVDSVKAMLKNGKISLSTQISTGKGSPWQLAADRQELTENTADEKKSDSAAETAIFYCTNCRQKYSGDVSYLGRDIVCTRCKNVFRASADSATNPIPDAAPTESKVASSSAAATPAAKSTDVFADPAPMASSFNWENNTGNIICPHCWQRFKSEQLLYIASHPSLLGDPILGADAMQRFAPIKFNARGQALDAMNYPTNETACPRCHLKIPMSIVDEKNLYFSLVGAPSSGKSYYLATLLNTLRRTLADQQNCTLLDVDPDMNRVLAHYEETIFRSARRREVAVLPKTQQTGDDFVNVVYLDNIPVHLPKPFVYELKFHTDDREDCNIIFYDNAGEQFEPGADNITNPGTRHLACSDGIIFIFDPLNDAIMRESCDRNEPQIASEQHIYDQTRLMSEMILRIRRHRNMAANDKCSIPLVIAVGKYDAWKNIFSRDINAIPLWQYRPGKLQSEWNQPMVMDISYNLRTLIMEFAPELINTAEGFFEQVILVPFSSFGCLSSVSGSGQIGVVPGDIKPVWAETPFLSLLAAKGLVNTAADRGDHPILQASFAGDFIIFEHPQKHTPVRLPRYYANAVITIDDQAYKLPSCADNNSDDLWS